MVHGSTAHLAPSPHQWCRQCGWGGTAAPKKQSAPESPPLTGPVVSPPAWSASATAPSDGATRCGRCRRHRACTVPWWQQQAAAKRRADAAAATAQWRVATKRCAIVRDGAAYAAALAELRAERERARAEAAAPGTPGGQ